MASPTRKSMVDLPPIAGKKRAADDKPSLLPAFEPISSSPQLPPKKRLRASSPDRLALLKQSPSKASNECSKYPTPVPTSSTGILSSSPPQTKTRRAPLQRTASTLSNRAPLASVPALELDVTGLPTLMGRSGRSSHHQLSANKYISRVHVTATYIHGEEEDKNDRVEIVCLGWNGVKVHCQGQAWNLEKNDTFTSEARDADIMVDVHGARVLIRWPISGRKAVTPSDSEFSLDSPTRATGIPLSPFSSPVRPRGVLHASVSPSPSPRRNVASVSAPIQIFEDEDDDKENAVPKALTQPSQSTTIMSQVLRSLHDEEEEDDFSDRDEENEPLVHEMGPNGSNILPRLEAFTTGNVKAEAIAKTPERPAKKKSSAEDQADPVLNHVLNQLAFSRLSSTPLSMLLNNLPSELRDEDKVTIEDLKTLIDRTACVGEVRRAGKDAAGKVLESEYYYLPEQDFDATRRDAVVDGLRKPGLRNCRKQHKQYYWRKPK